MPGDHEGIHGASWIRAEGDDLPHPVLVRLGKGDDGRLVATGVLIEADEGGELAARAMRVPLSRIVAGFVAATSKTATYKRLQRELHGRPKSDLGTGWAPGKGLDDTSWLAFDFLALADHERPIERARVRPGPKGWSDEHYREVARVYKRALRTDPRAPVKALMKAMNTTEPTAHRWIRTAREKGYITDPNEETR